MLGPFAGPLGTDAFVARYTAAGGIGTAFGDGYITTDFLAAARTGSPA